MADGDGAGKGKAEGSEMDCHRILISNGLDHFCCCQWAGRVTRQLCSSSPQLSPLRLFYFLNLFLLRTFTADAVFRSLSFLSFLPSHRFHCHSFL